MVSRGRRASANVLAAIPAPWRERFERLGRLAAARRATLCLVGGCVRDLLLKRKPLDWDVVAQGPAAGLVNEAAVQFGARVVQHPAFLTYTLHFQDGTSLDVATARRETYPEPASLPVVEPASLPDDFARRDFTVNAIAVRLDAERGKFEDPYDGRADMRRGLVRVLHARSFIDDPTRLYRAARYAGRYGWKLEPGTRRLFLAAVREKRPALLSPARLRAELERTLEEADPRPALKLLWTLGAALYWNESWRWTPFLAKTLGPVKFSAPLAYRLLLICCFRSPEEAQRDLHRLEFPKPVVETVGRGLRLLRAVERGDLAETAGLRLSDDVSAFLSVALGDPRLVKRLRDSAPVLNGADLQELGYAPGPAFQKIFESLRAARWTGSLRTRADEIRHVIDKFPRNH